ncbi:hypothetical protein ABEB36_013268 [Hypothenemus hampei]|uniref:Uncharacterized protein n=1 Tax=Hypothenemus hampei TaxID=57062 RepID=A0ABD1E7Q8_HYPHA
MGTKVAKEINNPDLDGKDFSGVMGIVIDARIQNGEGFKIRVILTPIPRVIMGILKFRHCLELGTNYREENWLLKRPSSDELGGSSSADRARNFYVKLTVLESSVYRTLMQPRFSAKSINF